MTRMTRVIRVYTCHTRIDTCHTRIDTCHVTYTLNHVFFVTRVIRVIHVYDSFICVIFLYYSEGRVDMLYVTLNALHLCVWQVSDENDCHDTCQHMWHDSLNMQYATLNALHLCAWDATQRCKNCIFVYECHGMHECHDTCVLWLIHVCDTTHWVYVCHLPLCGTKALFYIRVTLWGMSDTSQHLWMIKSPINETIFCKRDQ